MEDQGASVVINHHIADGQQNNYENWLVDIGKVCKSFPGHIDWQIIRPIAGLTYSYTIVIRFDTIIHMKQWMESEERQALIEKVKPLFTKDDNYYIRSGLDFLFPLEDQKVPVRWKQYLVTWSAIYPLSLLTPLLLLPVLKLLHVPDSKFINSFFISGCVVFAMVFIVMPKYTKLIRKWLYKNT